MKKLLFSMVLPVILVFAMTVAVFAAPSADNMSYKITLGTKPDGTATQTVKIWGRNVDGAENKLVGLKIWKPGKNATLYTEDLEADGVVNNLDYFAAILQTRADENGNFDFSFLYNEPANVYNTDIRVQDEPIVTLSIRTADIVAINNFITMINDPTLLATMDEDDFDVVFNNADDYGIDTRVYDNLTPANKTAVLDTIVDIFIENNSQSKRNTIVTFNESLIEQTLIKIFEQTDDSADLLDAFDVYADVLNIDAMENAAGIDDLYEAFGEDKGDVLSKMGLKSYDGIEDILDAFKETVFIKTLKTATYYADIEPWVDDNIDYLSEILNENDIDKYSNSRAIKKHVLTALNKQKSKIDDMNDFEDVFSRAVKSYGKEDDNNSSSGGSSSGGGGGSSNIFVSSDLNAVVAPSQTISAYSDMATHWAFPAVTYLSNARIVSGRGDGTFDPDSNITRAEYVKIIVEAYGLYNSKAKAEYTDVSAGDWYYQYIASMTEKGYILGDTDGRFRPNELISRQDMAVILHRVLIAKNLLPLIPELERLFDDFDTVSPYAQNSITYMSNMKLINGSDGKVRPHDPSTRAEAAQIIYNAIMEVGTK